MPSAIRQDEHRHFAERIDGENPVVPIRRTCLLMLNAHAIGKTNFMREALSAQRANGFDR
jgi:hypothetical protein